MDKIFSGHKMLKRKISVKYWECTISEKYTYIIIITYIHTYIHTNIHTNIHTYIHCILTSLRSINSGLSYMCCISHNKLWLFAGYCWQPFYYDNKQTSQIYSNTRPTCLGIILRMRPANERWRYRVTPSLISWAHTQNDPFMPVLTLRTPYTNRDQLNFCLGHG